MNLNRIKQTLADINQYGALDHGVTRLAYSEAEQSATKHFIRLCKEAGMSVRSDAAGNVIARREGLNPNLPAVACGSHLDTVISGGKYDGTLGVIAGLEVVRSLNDQGIQTLHPIEIIAFACEESSRFGVATIGSKAMAGVVKKELIESLNDMEGITLREAMAGCQLDMDRIHLAAQSKSTYKAFFELHIEQGPLLESMKKTIGLVHSIAAPTRLKVVVQGKASHSGTTPMDLRQDALLGMAQLALEVERLAKSEAACGTVATVGCCEIKPGAMNVIADRAELKIDIRSSSSTSKDRVLAGIIGYFEILKKDRGLTCSWELLCKEEPVELDTNVAASLEQTCTTLGIPYHKMLSGAGHDAMNMAKLCPTGLIFIPCKDGVSHHPEEHASLKDIEVGILVLQEEIMKWAVAKQQDRMGRIS